MNNTHIGMVVYGRYGTNDRGIVTGTSGNTLTVRWDDGSNGRYHVGDLISEKLYLEMKQEERMKSMALKPEQCIVGAVVYQAAKTAPLVKGVIAGPLNYQNNLVIVEWENSTLSKKDYRHLLDEKTGTAENQRLLDDQNRLEQEFEQVQAECATKLGQAAKLIREAGKLARSNGQYLQAMRDITNDLENALEEAGWSTSSWYC